MRLLSTHDLTFKELFDDQRKKYSILSHTWGDDEVMFKEMNKPKPGLELKAGYKKIIECARVSKERGLDWTWIDTCCIDKRSGAELTEAINSMFAWYNNSKECYVYLADFESDHHSSVGHFSERSLSAFQGSRWFTRGWTLQELIAPYKVLFFDMMWTLFGSIGDARLRLIIEDITGVPNELLIKIGGDGFFETRRSRPTKFNIAQKMSWAAHRTTTREDIAYCLLGLFGVNMPLLYGEGMKAFRRLQEEIIRQSADMSIFGWTHSGIPSPPSLLAFRPSSFSNTKLNKTYWNSFYTGPPFVKTHQGLQFQEYLVPVTQKMQEELSLVFQPHLFLLYLWGVSKENMTPAIILRRFQITDGGIDFIKTSLGSHLLVEMRQQRPKLLAGKRTLFYVQA